MRYKNINRTVFEYCILAIIFVFSSCDISTTNKNESPEDIPEIEKFVLSQTNSQPILTSEEPCDDQTDQAISNTDLAKKEVSKTKSRPLSPLSLSIWNHSNWEVEIDTIPESEFDTSKPTFDPNAYQDKKSNYGSTWKKVLADYPDEIVKSDSCCILKKVDGEIIMCNTYGDGEQSGSRYSLVGQKNQFVIFFKQGWEWYYYTLYNPTDRTAKGLAHRPIFLNDQIVFSFGNYYGEGQFDIYDLENNRFFGFDSFDWMLEKVYHDKNAFYFQFKSDQDFKSKRYLRIKYD